MPILLVVFIWASIFGLAGAIYLWLQEQSRKDVMERTLGASGADARRIIKASSSKPLDARVEKGDKLVLENDETREKAELMFW